jgi:hypothetical protein
MAAVNFKNNSSLSCIKVVDVCVYANAEAKERHFIQKQLVLLGVNDLFYDK